jgi:hypothetical protein
MSGTYADVAPVIQTLRFAIPSRVFMIDYEVLRSTSLPLVEEFLLRLIALTDGIDASAAADFYGLSQREFDKCLERLDRENLISVKSDGQIELSARALESMRNTEGVPRFQEIEECQQRFPVDLICFQHAQLPPKSDVWFKHTVEIERRSHGKGRVEDLVRAAFESSFYDLKKPPSSPGRVPANPNQQRARLHRVTQLLGRDFLSWAFETDVVQQPGDSLRTDLAFQNFTRVNEIESRRDLFAAIRTAIARLTPPPHQTLLPDSLTIVLKETPAQTAISANRLDDEHFYGLGLAEAGHDSDAAFFYGDFSRSDVLKLWSERFNAATRSWKKPRNDIPFPLIWLPPGNGLWARSGGVRSVLEDVRLTAEMKGRTLIPTLMVPVGADGFVTTPSPQRHKEAFAVARSVEAKNWPQNVEVVLVPGILAAILVHMRPTANCVVPLIAGLIISDPKRIETLESAMKITLGAYPSDPTRDWAPPREGVPSEVSEALAKVMWGA